MGWSGSGDILIRAIDKRLRLTGITWPRLGYGLAVVNHRFPSPPATGRIADRRGPGPADRAAETGPGGESRITIPGSG
ncbi:hypothetical protein GCM10010172_46430 [Paractinoplanes ferrugineus]|uniref:Uncharacterized protein n=1 Tax=Paractinoplanes ferrugineus TaxID=113564 RepID=A0A919J845_9ACTN|nr:hypothetical protein Afe05nite_76730 [Actinoplanes ferrugineus]